MHAAARVFAIPELMGLILDPYLEDIEIFYLRNISRGSRRFYADYKLWKLRTRHKDVYSGHTVKPRLPQAEDDDPKKVEWVYTSGPEAGNKVTEQKNSRRTRLHASTMCHPALSQASQPPAQNASSSSSTDPMPVTPSASQPAPSTAPVLPSFAAGSSQSSTSATQLPPTGLHQFSHRQEARSRWSSISDQVQNVSLNWLLMEKFPKFKYYPLSNMLGLEEVVPMGDFFTNPDASYRPLLLTNPPISEVPVIDWQSRIFDIENSKGVTMGDIVDALQRGEHRT